MVVLMFTIGLWKNNRINSGTKCNTGRAEERIRTMTHLIRMSNQDGQNEQDQTQQEQTETPGYK